MVDESKPTKQDQSTQNLLKWQGKLEPLIVSGYPLRMISPDKIALSNSGLRRASRADHAPGSGGIAGHCGLSAGRFGEQGARIV